MYRQFGLRSLVVAVLFAGLFLGLQFHMRVVGEEPFLGFVLKEEQVFGWPLPAYSRPTDRAVEENIAWFNSKSPDFMAQENDIRLRMTVWTWHWGGMAVNALMGILASILVCFLFDKVLNRTPRTPPAPPPDRSPSGK